MRRAPILIRSWDSLGSIAVPFSLRDFFAGVARRIFLFAHSLPQESVEFFASEKQMTQHPTRAQHATGDQSVHRWH